MPGDSRSKPSDDTGNTAGSPSGMSRRDFIRLNSALLFAATTVGCSVDDDFSDLRRSFHLLRADDLLSLRFRLYNLQIVHRAGAASRLQRIDDELDAYIEVVFTGQHIGEEAFPLTGDSGLPTTGSFARSVIARPTRLIFRIPQPVRSIALHVAALLDWQQWEAVHDDSPRTAPDSTRIEAPLGLTLSPAPGARWLHATEPVTHAGRTELWHTRLVSATDSQVPEVRIEQPGYEATERFEGSLSPAQRRDLTGKSVNARTLLLSPMGGWLDLRGAWQEGPIARWEHQASAGQDQRVLIQRQDGFLYPFGHRATLTIVTERAIDNEQMGTTGALLRKRRFIVIKEPTVQFDHASMALQAMTALDLVTPSLDVESEEATAFWIETEAGRPFRFRFAARDWAGDTLEFDAPAVFSAARGTAAEARTAYEAGAYATLRISRLNGQTAAIARFTDAERPSVDRWGAPLAKSRSAGDTSLRLVNLTFSATARAADELRLTNRPAPFVCATEALEARIPALEQFIADERNQGWFERINPEAEKDNPAEIFVRSLDRDRRIPLLFDQQADRCGGLAMPSLFVDGVSRVLGPVGDSASLNGDAPIDWTQYLAAGHATVLGRFSLTDMLTSTDGTKSLLVPRVDFTIEQKAVKTDTDEKRDPAKDADDDPEEEQEKDPAEEPGEDPATPSYHEVGVTLTWSVPLARGAGLPFIALQPKYGSPDNASRMQLELSAGVSKTIGVPTTARDAAETQEPGPDESAPASSGAWSAKALLKDFELRLGTTKEPMIVVGFDYLGVALGPPKPPGKDKDPEKEPEKEPEEDPQADTSDDKEKPASKFSAKIEHKISGFDAGGLLAYLQKLFDSAAHLPGRPQLPQFPSTQSASTGSGRSYPAKLPALGSADVNLKVGPLSAAEFDWLQFRVSNVAVAFGMGFYFFPRPVKGSDTPRIPDHEFWVRLADPARPLTLLAEPWGGIAHLGMNFTTAGLTGFQAGLGVLYRATLDLKITEAKCEGSVSGVFTYLLDDKGGSIDVDMVLRLSGQATLFIAEVHLLITAVGKWADNHFSFRADVYLRIKISFFTVPLHFAFETRSGEESGGEKSGDEESGKDSERPQVAALPGAVGLSQDDWLHYRSAFAGLG